MSNKLYMIMPIKNGIIPSGEVYNVQYPIKPFFFENSEEIKQWFLENIGCPIPQIYKLEYLEVFEEVKDVIKISDVGNDNYTYWTAVNKNSLIKYLIEKKEWREYVRFGVESPLRFFAAIYNAFEERGIKLNNVFKNNNDRISEFDVLNEIGFAKTERDIYTSINHLRGENIFTPSGSKEEEVLLERLQEMENERKRVRTKPLIHYPDNFI